MQACDRRGLRQQWPGLKAILDAMMDAASPWDHGDIVPRHIDDCLRRIMRLARLKQTDCPSIRCTLILAIAVCCATANWTYAQESQRPAVDPSQDRWVSVSVQPGGFGSQSPPQSRHGCCNRKGAIIGAAIGAAGGLFLAFGCDYDCTSSYIGAASLGGGIGAAIGAFADAKHGPSPFSDRRFRVRGVVSPTVRAVVTTVGFSGT
jgi:hypothetical protein